ncbi:uncharacterized protein BXIN_2515 [Babesia sp. Xinjiang]|uniref:uncharacterized protein n=1 Tax=Babesia sp. Xinjiang TaxID=462227 RepID=UPI000A25E492|nr:uncharacterized protein BXIN_2515 [Babesia sp. Xinjiang]ORM41429.1 hypothetical protein BXIN_2515 [Babesia sp. Xinjiang]
MLRCSRYMGLNLIHKVRFRPQRRSFGGIYRPVPDDVDDPWELEDPVSRPTAAYIEAPTIDIGTTLGSCATIDDIGILFSEYRPRLKPRELILLLSRIVDLTCRHREDCDDISSQLWPSNTFCMVPLSGLQGKVNLMRLPQVVANVYTDVISRVDTYAPTELLYLLRIGKYIRGYHNKLLRAHTERVITNSIWRLDPVDICRSVAVLASSDNVEFAKLLGHVTLKIFVEMDSKERLFVFKSLASARHGSTLFLQGSVRHALNTDLFLGNDVVQVLLCYARKPTACPPSVFESLLKRCVDLELSSLKPLELCDLIWVTCKYSNASVDMFRRCEPIILQHCYQLPGRSIAMLMWALAESGFESPELLAALESAAINSAESMSPTNVAVCAHSLAILKGFGDRSEFHSHVETEVINAISHFNGLDLAMLAEGYARLGLGSATLHQCIQEAALKYVEDLPADCLSKLLWAYGHLVGRESFFTGLQLALLQRLNQFTPHELSRALWAYAVQRFFDVKFWSTCLAMLDVDYIRGNNRCSLLYPALSELTTVRKEMLTSDVLRLLNLTRSVFTETELANYCNDTAQHIVTVLKSMDISAQFGVDFNGFILDVTFEHKGVKHAVLVYTRIKVIHVLSDPFNNMDDTERVELLSRQM